jgi:hypothetical protein
MEVYHITTVLSSAVVLMDEGLSYYYSCKLCSCINGKKQTLFLFYLINANIIKTNSN